MGASGGVPGRRYYDGEEPNRVLGFPVRPGQRWPLGDDDGQHALGLPEGWRGPAGAADTRWVRHPVYWCRWRAQVRRLGPYAPSFEDFMAAQRS
ncbi:MAG TPA: hypothetical protein VME46_16890 [Acidimicrobiales bacterium]|nr:hypothetical protein [Acidimicrobiales bacterium]